MRQRACWHPSLNNQDSLRIAAAQWISRPPKQAALLAAAQARNAETARAEPWRESCREGAASARRDGTTMPQYDRRRSTTKSAEMSRGAQPRVERPPEVHARVNGFDPNGRRDCSWATALTTPRLTCGAGFRRSFTPRSRSCHHPSPGSAYPEELAPRAFGALPEHRALRLSVPAKRTSRQRSSHSSGSSAQPATPRSRRQQEAKARRRGHNGLEGPGAGDAGVTGQSVDVSDLRA